ncbi:MAG TPA: TVP38/TMEM64 family protein [Vicinamibacterales bacterium]|jgi:uncharacterized membrane protein YdjX (TVP38/TMEM64 family)
MRIGAAIAVVVLALLWGGQRVAPHILPAVEKIQRLGAAGLPLFVLLYIVAVVLMVPGAWFTFAGGAVFGVLASFFCSLVGGTVGSTAAFLLGRHAARGVVQRTLATRPRLSAVERAVAKKGGRVVFLLRLSPVAPFNILNYVLGLTTMPARHFVMASVGMIPSTFLYAYSGKVAKEAILVADKAQAPQSASYYGMLVLGLAASAAATIVVARAARRALSEV